MHEAFSCKLSAFSEPSYFTTETHRVTDKGADEDLNFGKNDSGDKPAAVLRIAEASLCLRASVVEVLVSCT